VSAGVALGSMMDIARNKPIGFTGLLRDYSLFFERLGGTQ